MIRRFLDQGDRQQYAATQTILETTGERLPKAYPRSALTPGKVMCPYCSTLQVMGGWQCVGCGGEFLARHPWGD